MARYIDADAVMEVLERSAKDPRNETAMTSWANAFQELIDLLDDTLIPIATADVVEVVHGQWTDTTQGLICSACKTYQVYGSRFYNFCPICGADMRGGRNERK